MWEACSLLNDGKAKLLMNESGWHPGLFPLKKYWHLEFVKMLSLQILYVWFICVMLHTHQYCLCLISHISHIFPAPIGYIFVYHGVFTEISYSPHALSLCWWNWIELYITMKFQITWTKRRSNRFSKKKGFIKHFCTKQVQNVIRVIIKPGNLKSGERCFLKENDFLLGILYPKYQKRKKYMRRESNIFKHDMQSFFKKRYCLLLSLRKLLKDVLHQTRGET